MSVGIIDMFEIINVDEKNRYLIVITGGIGQFGLQRHLQISPVAYLSKRIQESQFLEFVDTTFVGHMGRIVAEDLNGTCDLTIITEHGKNLCGYRDSVSVPVVKVDLSLAAVSVHKGLIQGAP